MIILSSDTQWPVNAQTKGRSPEEKKTVKKRGQGHCPLGKHLSMSHHLYLGIARLATGICLILGGSKPLPGWFGALF